METAREMGTTTEKLTPKIMISRVLRKLKNCVIQHIGDLELMNPKFGSQKHMNKQHEFF